jgi:hypothetical protein
LKPAASTAVNGKNPLDAPVTASRDAKVHPARNTRFEFDLDRLGRLDKTMISQHPDDVLHHSRQTDSGSTGLDWGWS